MTWWRNVLEASGIFYSSSSESRCICVLRWGHLFSKICVDSCSCALEMILACEFKMTMMMMMYLRIEVVSSV